MRAHPMLDVYRITPDPDLVGRVPHATALYYMALPLAREDGEVSVAMAHPENATALAKLSCLLGSPVVPVRGSSTAIRSVLQSLRPPETHPAANVMYWSVDPEWLPSAASWAEILSKALDAPAALCGSLPSAADSYPGALLHEHYKLLILGLPFATAPSDVLTQATGPLFLMRGASVRPLRRILIVLRGYSSDEHALDWGVRLAQATPADLTLLPLTGAHPSALYEVLGSNGPSRQEIESHFQRPDLHGIHAHLAVRQGDPIRQIGDEAAAGDYDLILISAEGDGGFVGHVLAELDRRDVHSGRPVLILRPTT